MKYCWLWTLPWDVVNGVKSLFEIAYSNLVCYFGHSWKHWVDHESYDHYCTKCGIRWGWKGHFV